ncbi:MAG: HEAT repeat domain-containing protein [Thermodesulfobacteriota bacterium]|nr:HEAT repeat domain-containing protein [Thermodesulfobacteriota bacterium]
MTQKDIKKKGITGFTARVLNEVGAAVVNLYDFGAGAAGGLFSFSKKTSSKIIRKSVDYVSPDESKIIRDRIKIKQVKIEKIYTKIGKEETKQSQADKKDSETSENIKKLISDVKEYEGQIKKLQGTEAEIERKKIEAIEEKKKQAQEKKEAEKIAKARKKENRGIPAGDAVKKAIASSLKTYEFGSVSEKTKFEKVANDLLSKDQEIRILAANEFAKMKNEAAVPVLTESAGIGDTDLTLEIINALISIGSVNAVPLFKEKITDKSYRIRMACLRGIYKLAEGDTQALQLMANAVKDKHPEVRKSAVTFTGWQDNSEAVPALVQSLRDDDTGVKKAALSALATIRDKATVLPIIRILADDNSDIRQKALDTIQVITGEKIDFDMKAKGKNRSSAMDNLADWWEKKRTGDAELSTKEEQPEKKTAQAEITGKEEQPVEKTAQAEITGKEEQPVKKTAQAEITGKEEQPVKKTAQAEKKPTDW